MQTHRLELASSLAIIWSGSPNLQETSQRSCSTVTGGPNFSAIPVVCSWMGGMDPDKSLSAWTVATAEAERCKKADVCRKWILSESCPGSWHSR